MIQRVQTLYVLLGLILQFIGFDLYSFIISGEVLLILVPCSVCIFGLIAIFNYKNRISQIRILYFLSFIVSLMLISAIMCFDILAILLLLLSLVFYLIAIRNIRKDDDLINSINRLR